MNAAGYGYWATLWPVAVEKESLLISDAGPNEKMIQEAGRRDAGRFGSKWMYLQLCYGLLRRIGDGKMDFI